MRTLNRPMFRYGGPIKEGVMNGIREPKRNGGSMSPNEGPRRAALVGDPNFPQTNGRAHHVAPIVYGVGMGLARAAPLALRYGRQGVGLAKRGIGAIKGLFGKNKPFQGPVGSSTTGPTTVVRGGQRVPGASGSYSPISFKPGATTASSSGAPMGEAFVTNPLGTYLSGTMSGKLVSGLYKGATSPTAVGLTQKAGKAVWSVAKDPLTILSAGYYFYPDGTPKSDEDIAKQGEPPEGGLEGLLKTSVDSGAVKNEKVLTADEARKEKVQKYRDIMDIKGMNKDAAYDSLIAASQAVLGEGDFKGSLKDGSLINKIIGSTSKAFDKPGKTKDAINTLIAKAEIEKDINLSKGNTSTQQLKALSDATGKSQKFIANTKLGIANTAGEAKANLAKIKKGTVTSDDVTAVIASFAEDNGILFKQQITTEQKNEKVGKGKEYPSVTALIGALDLDPNGSDDGLYVVGTSVVEVIGGVPKLRG